MWSKGAFFYACKVENGIYKLVHVIMYNWRIRKNKMSETPWYSC